MERIGEVTAVHGEYIEVTFCRPTDCEKCQACHGGQKQTKLLVKGQAEIGDAAVVEMPVGMVMRASALAYALPLAGLMIGMFAGQAVYPAGGDLSALVGGAVGLGLAALAVKLTEGKRRGNAQWQPVLKEVIRKKEGE